ncbi:MAG: M42 family metallopeptidase [Candidatus Asgardarchaeia archaeon]
MDLFEVLKEVTETPGVAGFEYPVSDVIERYFREFADDVKKDVLGNVVAIKKGKNQKFRVMLAAHMDQIGFLVKYISKDGYIGMSDAGGFDPTTLIAQRVRIYTEKGFVRGVIGSIPPHLKRKPQQQPPAPPKLEDLVVDIGADSREEVEKLGIRVGSLITFDRTTERLSGDRVTGMAFDDRTGVVSLIRTLEILKDEEIGFNLYVVATSQEELGLRGAKVSAFNINPDMGIAIDVTFAKQPGVEEKTIGETKLGKGPDIAYGGNFNLRLSRFLEETAKEEKIPYQVSAQGRPPGTDAYVIQITRAGVVTGLVSIPLRYMHTSVEVASLSDIENTGKLLASVIKRIKPEDWNYRIEI